MRWRFENTGLSSGVFNMDYDAALAGALISGTGNFTVRLYGWKPHAISIGFNQRPEEIDREKVSLLGIDIVRRPTGGRAVLHCEELTYSVVMRVKKRSVLSVYEEISKPLIAGLAEFNVPAAVEKSQPFFPALYRTKSAAACFSSAGRYEIKCKGKKLVGSAQRRYAAENGDEVVLQHGSLLLGPGHKRIVDFLNLPDQEDRRKLQDELENRTIDLSSILGRKVEFGEAAEVMMRGFQKTWAAGPDGDDKDFNNQKVAV
jgi:lipoate-protein ligase A